MKVAPLEAELVGCILVVVSFEPLDCAVMFGVPVEIQGIVFNHFNHICVHDCGGLIQTGGLCSKGESH